MSQPNVYLNLHQMKTLKVHIMPSKTAPSCFLLWAGYCLHLHPRYTFYHYMRCHQCLAEQLTCLVRWRNSLIYYEIIICHFKTQICMNAMTATPISTRMCKLILTFNCFQSDWLCWPMKTRILYKHKHILLPSPAWKFKKHKFQHFTIWSADKTSKSLNTMENEWNTP